MENSDGRKKFAIAGVAGYIAPRHLGAIHALGHELTTAHDLSDSVGIMDRYFPGADFTTDWSSFERQLRRGAADYLTVCTPNHMHLPHTLAGLAAGAHVICEKPLGLTPGEIDRMIEAERSSGRNVRTILQLRLHPEIVRLKQAVAEGPADRVYDIELTYVTPRGRWYAASWKGDTARSGGVATNIGVHFYDMLLWIFGPVVQSRVHYAAADCIAGFLRLKRARVRYFLSIDSRHLPHTEGGGMQAYRKLSIDTEAFDFSSGFTDLHTESYRRILAGEGFGPHDARAVVALLHDIRRTVPEGLVGDYHPMAFGLERRVHPVSTAKPSEHVG